MNMVTISAFTGLVIFGVLAVAVGRFPLYLLGCGAVTFLCFGIDKYAAVRGWRRIPELSLWLLSLLGGAIPACAAMLLFRHKIRKPLFFLPVVAMALIQLFLIYKFL